MPELPEVETVVRGLRRAKLHRKRICGVSVSWPRTLAGIEPKLFNDIVSGQHINRISRRAKFIVLRLSGDWFLLIHLRMTGSLRVEDTDSPIGAYDRAVLHFEDGRSLCFRDTRKFGRWYLTENPALILGHLGPEPLGKAFTCARFAEMILPRKRMLKPLLLDQSFVAGLGNIYVDEALFAAGLHPCRLANTLEPVDIEKLHTSIIAVLRLGISRMGTSLGGSSVNFYSVAGRRGRNQDALQVFRRDGESCLVCGRKIVRIVVGQRSTHVCLHCQPAS